MAARRKVRGRREARGRVLVTGGPTRAYLDRVRYLTNFSTGELAYVLCRQLIRRGFDVALVSGPTAQPFHRLKLARWKPVETAEQMHREVLGLCRSFRPDAAVFAAAVLDFAPATRREGKVSSSVKRWTLTLRPTAKILDDVGRRFPKVKRVGFKLEWNKRRRPEAWGRALVGRKGLDALVLNYLPDIGGKSHPAWFLTADGQASRPRTKPEIASAIASFLVALS